MSSTRCPCCRRALALRDHLRGELVRCPMCGTTFEAPEEPAPARTIPPGSPVTQTPGVPPPPPRPAPAPDFDAESLRGDPRLTPDDQASLRSAAAWLEVAAALQVLGTVFCSCPGFFLYLAWGFRRSGIALLVGLGVMVLWVVVLVVLGAGPRHLRERRDYRLALTSGILTFPAALSSLAQSAYLAWQAHDIPEPDLLDLALFVVALGLACTLIALVAGLKTLAALLRPGVKESFR